MCRGRHVTRRVKRGRRGGEVYRGGRQDKEGRIQSEMKGMGPETEEIKRRGEVRREQGRRAQVRDTRGRERERGGREQGEDERKSDEQKADLQMDDPSSRCGEGRFCRALPPRTPVHAPIGRARWPPDRTSTPCLVSDRPARTAPLLAEPHRSGQPAGRLPPPPLAVRAPAVRASDHTAPQPSATLRGDWPAYPHAAGGP